MILAEKIIALRKKNDWSQEDLAEKLNVSRQSISKWESGASLPDMNRVLDMSRLFGVTTDSLLKDEIEEPAYDQREEETVPRVTAEEANGFLAAAAVYARQLALCVMLCILSPVPLLALLGMSQLPQALLSEELAAGAGVAILLLTVACAVAGFILSAGRMKRYEYLDGGAFEMAYGVSGIVGERSAAYERRGSTGIVSGVALCIVSPVPLILGGVMGASDSACVLLTALLLVIAAVGVYLLVDASALRGSFQRLLREGEYNPVWKERNRKSQRISGFYWPLITAVYLGASFITMRWDITWIIWVVAGLVWAAIAALLEKE